MEEQVSATLSYLPRSQGSVTMTEELLTESTAGYVVMLTAGQEDGGKRAILAFSLACTAQSMGRNTIIFMIGDGAHWAYEGHATAIDVAGFPPLDELMESFIELGGELYVCSACDKVCSMPTGGGMPLTRKPEVQPLGLASLLPHLEGARSITF
jgi:predicted peroxiredoxin